MPDEKQADPFEAIPSELVNLNEIHLRRLARRKGALDRAGKKTERRLEPLMRAHREAVRAFEDHYDDAFLKYSRDPSKMAMDDRDPQEMKKARLLKRSVLVNCFT